MNNPDPKALAEKTPDLEPLLRHAVADRDRLRRKVLEQAQALREQATEIERLRAALQAVELEARDMTRTKAATIENILRIAVKALRGEEK